MRESERRKALGDWGEARALELMKRLGSGFANARDVNAQNTQSPVRRHLRRARSERFLIGVKTRCMYQKCGDLNATYNVRKKSHGAAAVARPNSALRLSDFSCLGPRGSALVARSYPRFVATSGLLFNDRRLSEAFKLLPSLGSKLDDLNFSVWRNSAPA